MDGYQVDSSLAGSPMMRNRQQFPQLVDGRQAQDAAPKGKLILRGADVDSHAIILGVFIDLLAAPFCYEGSAALMAKLWGKALVAYAIGIPLALMGLSIVVIY